MSRSLCFSLMASLTGGLCLYVGAFAARMGSSKSLAALGIYLGALSGALLIRQWPSRSDGKTVTESSHWKSFFKIESRNTLPFGSGVLLSLATLCYFQSMSLGLSISIATLFFQSGFLFSSLVALIVFKEKLVGRRLIGWLFLAAAIVTLGVRP